MSLLQPARSLPRSLGVRTLRQSAAPLPGSSASRIAFAFDIDGVLKAGPTVLEPARRALHLLEGNNARSVRVPYVYVTNGGGPSETERAALLQRELGVPVSITAAEDCWAAGLAKYCPASAGDGGAGLCGCSDSVQHTPMAP